MIRHKLTWFLLTVLCPALLLADEQALELDPIVVVASKRPVPLSEISGQISLITAETIETTMTANLDDLLRYEPGVEVASAGTRFGAESITLRGLGGNRVALEVDGVPIRNGFAIGSYSNAGRTLVETDRIKRLEILHGPASTLYGSDALGGVLSFTTWNPADLVARGSGSTWFSVNAGHDSADQSYVVSGQAAGLSGAHGLLISATGRDGNQLESSAAEDHDLDPQSWSTRDLALRYTYDTANADQVRVGIEQFERETVTDVRSLLGYGRFRRTTLLEGDDQDERQQVLVDYNFSRPWLDTGVARAFFVNTSTVQNTIEQRDPPPYPSRIERTFALDTDQWGIEINGFHNVLWGQSDHALGAGIEYLDTTLEESRNGHEENLATGEISQSILGESFPTRDFPNSVTRELGLFIEDEITLGGGRWALTPALRFERYELSPQSDAVYSGAFPEAGLVSLTEQQVTPRLALRYTINDQWSVYGQWTEGFRAPPVEDVNIGFELPRFGFRAIPNPDLKSETSRGYELGLRYFGSDSRLSLTWFDTRFENLIESRARIGFDPLSGYLVFQSRNIGKARIYGADLRYDQDLAAFSPALEGWFLKTAAFWSQGDNDSNGQPLNTISPPQAVIGLAWQSSNGRLDAEFNSTLTDQQDRVDSSDGERFSPPSSAVFDLTVGWQISARVSLRAGLFNLTDETYWRWQDVNRLDPDDPMIPLLARPGRSIRANLRVSAF